MARAAAIDEFKEQDRRRSTLPEGERAEVHRRRRCRRRFDALRGARRPRDHPRRHAHRRPRRRSRSAHIACEVGVLPRTHGSAIFQRGETQALVVATLGTVSDEQRVDGLQDEYSQEVHARLQLPAVLASASASRSAGRAGARSATACWPSGRSRRSSRRRRSSRTPSALVSDILESNGSSQHGVASAAGRWR